MDKNFYCVRVVRLGQRLARGGGKCVELFEAGAWSKVSEVGQCKVSVQKRSAVRSLLTRTTLSFCE